MIYRPQFAYATPAGCSDDGFEHYYDTTNITIQTIPSLSTIRGILFQLDKDAQFLWRGFKIATADADPGLAVQWKDGEGNLLSDDTINILLCGVPQGYAAPFQAGMAVAWDQEIVCAPGSVIESNWSNEIADFRGRQGADIPPAVTLLGVKRRYHRRFQ